MLIRNTHSQEVKCVITPPHKGPITPPASALAPISPKTIGELNFGTIFDAAAIEIGINAPPPIA